MEQKNYFEKTKVETKSELNTLTEVLTNHIVDLKPDWSGNKEIKSKYSDNLFAAQESEILRTTPPLEIEKLNIEKGKSVVLIGPNGSGKSTLFDAIMGIRKADFNGGSFGNFKGVHGKESLRIARLDQEELLDGIENQTVKDVMDFVVEHFKKDFPVDWENPEADFDANMANQDAQTRIDELVGKAGKLFEIEHFMSRKIGELSGGERTKISLMMILGSEPDLLLLDEPTNHLDLESIAKLTGLFENYKKAGVGIVSSSHVDWFLDMVGRDGTMEIMQSKEKRELVSSNSPHDKFTKRENSSGIMEGDLNWNQPKQMKNQGISLFKVSNEISIPESPLKNIEMPTIRVGDLVVFSGKNGTGKTKLMEQIAGIGERDILEKEKGMQIAYMPQFWPDEVAEGNVRVFFNWIKESINPHTDIEENRFMKELRNLNFKSDATKSLLEKPLASLSGGEQRLLWFVGASIIEGTDALVLDEPTNHMDKRTAKIATEAIKNFKGAVILSTHDLRLMEALEENPGQTRVGKRTTHVLFQRGKNGTELEISRQSPSSYAKETISQSQSSAKRLKVG